MKKFLCFIFILMLSLLLTACQNKEYNEPKDNTKFKNYLTDTLNTIDEKKVDERFGKVKSPSKYLEEIKFKNTKITNTYKSDRYGTSSDTIYLWEEDEEYFMYYESMNQLQSFSLSQLDSYVDDYENMKVSKAINTLLSDSGLDMELDDFFDCLEFSIDDFEETDNKNVYQLKNKSIAKFISKVTKKAGNEIPSSDVSDFLNEFKKFKCFVTYGNGKIRALSFEIDHTINGQKVSGTFAINFLYDQEVGINGLKFDVDMKITGMITSSSSQSYYIGESEMREYIEKGWCKYDFNVGPSSFEILDVNNCPVKAVYEQLYIQDYNRYQLYVKIEEHGEPKDLTVKGSYTVTTSSMDLDATLSGSLLEDAYEGSNKVTVKASLNSESLTAEYKIGKTNVLTANIKLKDNYLNSGKVVITDPDSGDTQTYEITTGSKVEIPDKDTISGESLVKSTWKFYRAESGDDTSLYEYSLGDYQDGIYITEDYMTITCNPDGTGKIIVDMGDDSQNIDITWSGSNNNYKFYFNGYTYDVRVHGNELEMSIHEGEFYQLFVLHKQ